MILNLLFKPFKHSLNWCVVWTVRGSSTRFRLFCLLIMAWVCYGWGRHDWETCFRVSVMLTYVVVSKPRSFSLFDSFRLVHPGLMPIDMRNNHLHFNVKYIFYFVQFAWVVNENLVDLGWVNYSKGSLLILD